ncbi:hypothetical protein THAOC_14846 [Thalassiosira oceanica]|uniref:Uncharacterized protein n=1 Tax=Thalassiosira oceanica TaxID=159749 RepID=K0SE53_THAOC|nr:hypothetical protein THAOC_14846 [Thalassiosira oceanica]|eukprot:EJK64418.1 hypothetical protein THAOC_14846 [Thalassiosira oceanica]
MKPEDEENVSCLKPSMEVISKRPLASPIKHHMLSPIRPKVYVPTQFRRCMEPLTIKQRLSDVVKAIKKRSPHRQDSNLRGRSPVDFESTSLTTRTRCVVVGDDILQFMKFVHTYATDCFDSSRFARGSLDCGSTLGEGVRAL